MRGERRSSLTPREREVLALVRVGLTNEEIAGRLGISPDTAKYHVSQILAKLGAATREEAAALAMPEERGWWQRLGAWGLAAKLGLVAAAVVVLAGMGLLAWAVASTGAGDSNEAIDGATTSANSQPTPSPLASLPIPWVDSTPAPGPTEEPAPTVDPAVLAVPECRGDQLAGAHTGSRFQGGYTFIEFVIANVSADLCRLSGRPASFQYLGARGDVLLSGTQTECATHTCTQFVLAPNGSVATTGDEDPASRALFSVRGYDPAPGACDGAGAVAEIVLSMPGGGNLDIPAAESGKCLGTDLGSFVSEEQTIRPPTAPPTTLITAIQMPAKTTAGQELNFTVEVTNVSDRAFSFGDACPNYILIIGNKDVYDTHSLNCRPVSAIEPGGHILFAMKVAIPANLELGTYDVSWTLDASYASPDTTSVPSLEIIAP
jgi:DNA-binding CsgD family transcriptional regulator